MRSEDALNLVIFGAQGAGGNGTKVRLFSDLTPATGKGALKQGNRHSNKVSGSGTASERRAVERRAAP